MAASTSRSGPDRSIHQDYIARIRYSNTLPPPPNPPKLLEIPNTGISSGVYTAPGFASRLARDQPLNIEADAELGMPLDLVGMPGVFDGDESSIQAPLITPKPHVHDLPLLRPLNALGKPKSFNDGNVSFLRRTEYISNVKRLDAATLKASRPQKAPPSTLTKLPDADKESPEYILAAVTRSFDTAALNLQTPSRIRHPTKRNLKLVESYPLLPDLAAMPAEPGAYIAVKFAHNPVPPSSTYDARVPVGILRPLAPTEDAQAAHNRAQALYECDPSRNPPPEPLQDYEFLLPETARDAEAVKRKLDVMDPERDEEELYTCVNSDGEKCFRYKRVRAYETAHAIDLGTQRWDEEIALGIQEREIDGGERVKAAWIYPLILKATVRSQRKKNIERLRFGEQEDTEQIIDFLDLRVNEETEEESAAREVFMKWPNGPPESEKEKEAGEDEGAEDAHAEEDVDADAESE